jgi:hypothetical protein
VFRFFEICSLSYSKTMLASLGRFLQEGRAGVESRKLGKGERVGLAKSLAQ